MMASLVLVLGTLSLLARPTTALDFNYTGAIRNTAQFVPSILMCNNSFSAANATGTYTISPGLSLGSTKQGNGTAFGSDISLAVTGGILSGGLQASLHINYGKMNWLNNVQTGYDVCAFATDPGLLNTNTLLRAQADNGSSLQTYDSRCKAAIQEQFNNATKAVNRPAAQGVTALPGICQTIFENVSPGPPKECIPFYQPTASKWLLYNFPLTQSPNTGLSGIASACQSTNETGAVYYNILTLFSNGYSDSAYDIMTILPAPFVTVFMPITFGSETSKSIITEPYTEVTVLHMSRTNPGSRSKPSWPAAAPVDYSGYDALVNGNATNSTTNSTSSSSPAATSSSSSSSGGISAGAIAGIVIGVVALLALAGIIAFFCIRRRRSNLKHPDATELDAGGYGQSEKRMEVSGEGMHEMSPNSHKTSELASPDFPRHELPTGVAYGHEMDGSRPLVELPGDSPDKEKPR